MLYQLVGAFVVLAIAAAALDQLSFRSTPLAWGSILFQGIIMSFGTLLAWFWLLRRYLASRLSILSFMTPLFGVSFGVLILDEPLDGAFVAGALMVLAGISLVSGAGLLREALRRGRRA